MYIVSVLITPLIFPFPKESRLPDVNSKAKHKQKTLTLTLTLTKSFCVLRIRSVPLTSYPSISLQQLERNLRKGVGSGLDVLTLTPRSRSVNTEALIIASSLETFNSKLTFPVLC